MLTCIHTYTHAYIQLVEKTGQELTAAMKAKEVLDGDILILREMNAKKHDKDKTSDR
jgi:hypothetical protein